MTQEERAYKKIRDGWGIVSDGESDLLRIWFKKQNLPERFRDYFSLNSLAGGEFALDFCREPITDNWSMDNGIEYLLVHNLSNGFISSTSDAYQIAIDLLTTKGVKVIENKEVTE